MRGSGPERKVASIEVERMDLRIRRTLDPPGLELSGEVDASNAPELDRSTVDDDLTSPFTAQRPQFAGRLRSANRRHSRADALGQ